MSNANVNIVAFSYDQHGKDGVEEAPKMDPGALYAMIFGSEKFEPLIGELSMASHMTGGEDEADVHPKLKAFKQRQREVRCAVHLAEKLQKYVDNGEHDFSQWAHDEANELGQSAFGGTLLNVIGTTYLEQVSFSVVYMHWRVSNMCDILSSMVDATRLNSNLVVWLVWVCR